VNSGFELDGLAFFFADKRVIDDVSLHLEPGKFYGVVGPNGCGKTTMVDLLCRFREPKRGGIRYNGRALAAYSKKQLAREIALVPQNFYINFPFTVCDVVMMGRYPYMTRFSGPSRRDSEIVSSVMEKADIDGMAGRFITELSGGERQRVVFARALAQDTSVLILDEATSNLDIGHVVRLLGLAALRVHAEGKTVIGVFQDINQAAAWCDQLIFMSGGRIAACGKTSEVLTGDTMRTVFGVDAKVYFEAFSDSFQVAYKTEGARSLRFKGFEGNA
jgi:ABC-type cobalamin/Fe3+-siderophores transport system ATPase subunit